MIEALEARLAEAEKAQAESEKLQKEFVKAMAAYAKEVAAILSKSGAAVEGVSERAWANEVMITYKTNGKTKLPEQPSRQTSKQHRALHQHQIDEIKNALFLLRMSSEPAINTSAYKDVVAYL